MATRISISLPDRLAEAIEATAATVGLSVSAWLGAAAERRLFDDSMTGLRHDVGPVEQSRMRRILTAQQACAAGEAGSRVA